MGSYRGKLLHVAERDIYHDVFEVVKVYPNKSTLYLFKNVNMVRKAGYEDFNAADFGAQDYNFNPSTAQDSLERSLRRSKQLITDVVLCNDFDIFATFTFKKERQNIELCKSKMSNWLHSQQKTHGRFKYLIVPEFHKDKKSIHFHALMKDYKGNITASGKFINGRESYNLLSYRSGFTTAVYIDDPEAVSLYVRKYITKDMPMLPGKKRFWLSTGLERPVSLVNQGIFAREHMSWGLIHNNEIFATYETL